MVWLDQDHISIRTNEIQMDLYISTEENLYLNPSYPNTYATLSDISFLFFYFSTQREILFAIYPEARGVAVPVGFCYSCQVTVH